MLRRTSVSEPSPNHKPAEKDIDQELKMIYQDEHGKTPDLSKLDVRRQSRLRRFAGWMTLILLLFGGITWSGYLVFQKTVAPSQKILTVTIDGPKEVISGEKTEFDIRYENHGQVPIASLEIKLNLPDGFHVQLADPPMSSAGNVWTVGSVTAGSDGLIRLEGMWTDTVPSASSIQAISTYRPANFNADFQDIATHSVAITSSVLRLTTDAPPTAVPGTDTSYTFHLKNTAANSVDNARIRLSLPATFIVSTSNPSLSEGTTEWNLGTIAAEETKNVTVTGTFAADAAGSQTVSAEAGLMRGHTFLTQGSIITSTDVLGGDLAIRLIVNGSTESQSIAPGKILNVSIDVTNKGTALAEGLALELVLTSGSMETPIDWTKADLAGGVRTGNKISWSSAVLSQKGLLPADGRETIDLSLPLLSSGGAESFSISTNASLQKIGSTTTNRLLQSTPLTVSLSADTHFDARGWYYEDGTPVGSGPLPPAVGQTTTYRLFWTIGTSTHALDNVRVNATIPSNVTFVEQKEVATGTLSFDNSTRILTWNIDRLAANTGEVTAAFDVSITPKVGDIGTFIKLIGESTFTATDDKADTNIKQTDEAITSEIPDDTDAAGKGSVSE